MYKLFQVKNIAMAVAAGSIFMAPAPGVAQYDQLQRQKEQQQTELQRRQVLEQYDQDMNLLRQQQLQQEQQRQERQQQQQRQLDQEQQRKLYEGGKRRDLK